VDSHGGSGVIDIHVAKAERSLTISFGSFPLFRIANPNLIICIYYNCQLHLFYKNSILISRDPPW
jgi:hypothetical protein